MMEFAIYNLNRSLAGMNMAVCGSRVSLHQSLKENCPRDKVLFIDDDSEGLVDCTIDRLLSRLKDNSRPPLLTYVASTIITIG
jgi:hypothetical protein